MGETVGMSGTFYIVTEDDDPGRVEIEFGPILGGKSNSASKMLIPLVGLHQTAPTVPSRGSEKSCQPNHVRQYQHNNTHYSANIRYSVLLR
jgi:hypothetical protein